MLELLEEEIGISQSEDEKTEEFFFNSLQINPHLGDIKFDDIMPNLSKTKIKNNLKDEFDIVMTNGNSIG